MPRTWTEEQKQELRDRMVALRAAKAEAIARGEPLPERKSKGQKAKQAAAPAGNVTETAEFRMAVQRAVEQAVANLLPKGIPAPATNGGNATLEQLTRQLALSIGDLTNQNSGQKLVSPEVLADRREAEELMYRRLDQARRAVAAAQERGDQAAVDLAMPHYRLTAKIIAPLMSGDELIEPMRRGADNIVVPTEIDWLLPPNLAMVPMNGPAQEVFALFKRSIGNQVSTRVVRVAGQDADAEPVYANSNESYMLTSQGHAVTGGSASLKLRNTVELELGSPPATGNPLDRGVARIRGQNPARQHSGPPTIQVRTLGTIAPPAVQNG